MTAAAAPIVNPFQNGLCGVRCSCRLPYGDGGGGGGDGGGVSAYFTVTNTVSTAFWPSRYDVGRRRGRGWGRRSDRGRSCAEESCSVHVQSARSIIETMHVFQEGGRRISVLPFALSESVNVTTARTEDDRDAFASMYGLQAAVGFGRRNRNCGLTTTNKNFMTLLHGVMNKGRYPAELVIAHQRDFYQNALFPSIKRSYVLPDIGDGEAPREVKLQLYGESLAVNLQKFDAPSLTQFGPEVLGNLLQEARLDTDLNRLCVDAEQRFGRNLKEAEKRELLFCYYSCRWLERSGAAEPPESAVGEMRRWVTERLSTRESDHARYAHSFRRRRRKNSEIYDILGDSTDACRRCPHVRPFASFVRRFLRDQGHLLAAEVVAAAWPEKESSSTTGSAAAAATAAAADARHWWNTHMLQKMCTLF